jgi:hypothetical protein
MRAPTVQFAAYLGARQMLGIALLVAGAVALGASLWQYAAAARELAHIEAAIGSARENAEQRRAAASVRPAPQVAEQRIGAINNTIARLNIPWNALFAAFEADKSKDVALLALLPDARRRVLIVQAETVTPGAMTDFVGRLRSTALFEDAVLVKHERREQDAGQPYRFAVEVRWKEGQ